MVSIFQQAREQKQAEPYKNNKERNTSELIKPEGNSSNAASNKFRNIGNSEYRIGVGIVLDTLPFNHTYRVGTDLGSPPIVCHALQSTLCGDPMVGSCVGYPAGASVIVIYDGARSTGVILGGYDIPSGLENYAYRTLLSGNSRRYDEDEVTNKSIIINKDADDDDDIVFGNGSYHAGNVSFDEHGDVPEWGFSCLTGTKMFADPYMILLGTDDYTALSIFNKDSLMRLSAINYQMRTSGREEEYLNDEGEYIEYRGSCLMPYEQLGYFTESGEKLVDNNTDDEENNTPWYKEGSIQAPFEPVNIARLAPFHRVMEFGGWLGQGDFTQVILPPDDIDYMQFADVVAKGVSRCQRNVDGRLSMSTTRGISITKEGVIPAVVRATRPDEISKTLGDNKDNYKHTDLEIPKEIQISSDAASASMQRAIGIMDYNGYNKNWAEIFQIAYHTGDFTMPEESVFSEKSINAPSYGDLKSKYLLSEDATYTAKVDDKREIEYTQNEAGIHLLPDGGIVIYDGSGSEIRFVKGQITISCAGDINIKPGRNINLWAGNDIIERARGCIEISSTDKSVRIKAEETLSMLGANNGSDTDGVIIESKSMASQYDFANLGDEIITNGIVFKSKDSPIAALGDIVYLRSGVEGNSGKGLILDAGKGKADIYVNTKSVTEYVDQDHIINFFNRSSSRVEGTTRFSADTTYLLGDTIVTGGMTIDGMILMSKDVISCGTIQSYGNQSGMVSPIGAETKAKMVSTINKFMNMPKEDYPEVESKLYTQSISTLIYNEKCIGNDTTLKGLGFSFRTDEQLKLPEDYYVYEDLWQHISANSDSPVTDTWEETYVTCSAGITYPFPGKQCYTDAKYVTQETVFADFKAGKYIDRKVELGATKPSEEKYLNPEYGAQEKKSLNYYTIIKK